MNGHVEQHYDKNTEYEWTRLDRHRTEFAVTMRALQAYLPPSPATILDIGGGPGRYAIALAEQGYRVTLVDLSQNNLQMAAQKSVEASINLVALVHGDAITLPALPETEYDVVLLLGPLYHLITADLRHQAIQQARHVLKSGGLLFAAFITRFAPIRNMATDYPEQLLQQSEQYAEILATGIHHVTPESDFTDAYFARPEEIRPFLEANHFEILTLIGCEGIVAGHEDKINELDGELWQAWVELNYQLGQDPSLYGAADHLLAVGRKMGE